MAEFEHIFSRELTFLKRVAAKLRSLFWRRRRLREFGASQVPPDGPQTPGPQTPRHVAWKPVIRWRQRPSIRAAAAIAGSIIVHAVAILWLVQLALDRAPSAGREEPIIVQIRLRAPAPKLPLAPEAASEPEPESLREPDPVPEPDRAATPAPAPEPLPPVPDAAPDAAPADPAPTAPRPSSAPLRPRFIGLAGPPPLGTPTTTGTGSAARYGGKAAALARYGGSGATENAVEAGLRWLAAHQEAEGHWDADGFQRRCRHHEPCSGRGQPEYDVGVTALALLAFLGAGHDATADGPYRRHLRKGLEYLTSVQDGAGAFGAQGSTYFYNHALATFALAEAGAALQRTPGGADLATRVRESVEAALRFSWRAQQSGGGWDYTTERTNRNDLSITGWQILAIQAARNSGVAAAEELVPGARRFLRSAFTATGHGVYADKGPEATRGGVNIAAVGLLSYLMLGGSPDASAARLAADRIIRSHPPNWDAAARWDRTFQSYYYWYTATLCLFHLGGERWDAWNRLLLESLLPLQSRRPHEEGSWPPEPNWIGQSGGRVYATAISVLTLETYYRYEPLSALRP